MTSPSQKQGHFYEEKAEEKLNAAGWKTIERNYTAKTGEIDLIMRKRSVIAFVEVRYRKSSFFGDALASVTAGKQRRIINTANVYLAKNKWHDKYQSRFDLVVFDGDQCEWIENAFETH